ncbi:hypothetical protein HUG17_0603 [Dermatophagoides farinae]|uniref:Uncharacterized protein n=1 Tax=Dermatophagoides farinae TaxID=6954 RepID=A0A9D4P8J6_DERFA|nr:adult-specific rigid cuticular protein 15.7-like [Dermatophagoides farinae]KAH7645065.1 hypothetical protein HUG17_0603 [Dermatophagoides farinae]
MVGVCAVNINGNPMHGPAMVNTGHSAQFRSQDSLGNYAFGYNEDHATGGTFRRETGSPGMAHGSYGLRTIDGRVRVVNYVADGHGFRANIQTNEPGVDPDQDPASVLINKAAAIVAPYLHKQIEPVAAPIAMQHSIEAPMMANYEPAPLAAPAPAIIESAPYGAGPLMDHGAPAAAILSKYEPAAPILDSAPLLASSYGGKPYASASAPILSTDDSVYPMLNKAGPIYDAPLGYHKNK